jgi:hypothetical protein
MATKKLQILDSLIKQAENTDTLDGKHASYFEELIDTNLVQKADISDTLAGYGITDAYTKDESKNNFSLFENVKAHGVVANDESKAEDNANNIQSLIDYCYNNGISTIYFPEGNYYIDKPIYLYEYMEIKGQSQYTTHITKTTNVADRNGVDSIIAFENYNEDKKSSTTNGQKIKCIDIVGNTSYVADKAEEDRQIGIYAYVNSPYVVVEEIETHNVDHAVDLKGAWIGRFSKHKIRSHYIGFRTRSQSQGIVLSGINVIGTHEYGFYLTGSNYGSLDSIFVEWAYGGIAFYFGWGTYAINGIGYEISRDLTDGIYAYKSNVSISNAMLPQQNSDEFNAIHALSSSVVDLKSSTYGFQSQQYTDLRSGRLYKVESSSKLFLRSSVRCGLVNCAEFPIESICDGTSEAVNEVMNNLDEITSEVTNNLNYKFVGGYFTIPEELTDYISSNSSWYCQRIGRAVITTVVITALLDFPDTITDTTAVTLDGLPYTCFGTSSRQVVWTTQNKLKNVIIKANSSSFTFYGGLKKGESITSTITYMATNT